jgi:hypothetical protein
MHTLHLSYQSIGGKENRNHSRRKNLGLEQQHRDRQRHQDELKSREAHDARSRIKRSFLIRARSRSN